MRHSPVGMMLIALLICLPSHVSAREPAQKTPNSLGSLERQREQLLKELLEKTRKSFKQGHSTLEDVIHAEKQLLEAQLASAQTRNERIAIRESQVKIAEQQKDIVEQGVQDGSLDPIELNRAKVHLLELQIALVRERERVQESQTSQLGGEFDPAYAKQRLEVQLGIRFQKIKIAEAEREVAILAVEQAEQQIEAQQNVLRKAQEQVARSKKLFEQGIESESRYQQTVNVLDATETAVKAYQQEVVSRERELKIHDARVRVMELKAKLVELELDRLRSGEH